MSNKIEISEEKMINLFIKFMGKTYEFIFLMSSLFIFYVIIKDILKIYVLINFPDLFDCVNN